MVYSAGETRQWPSSRKARISGHRMSLAMDDEDSVDEERQGIRQVLTAYTSGALYTTLVSRMFCSAPRIPSAETLKAYQSIYDHGYGVSRDEWHRRSSSRPGARAVSITHRPHGSREVDT